MTIAIGDSAERTRTVTDAAIAAFASASGDENPVHTDPVYAATTRFGRPIAHGMLSASLISAILGNDLPGPGSIYLSQTLSFKAPVYASDPITGRVECIKFREDKSIATFRTTVINQDGVLVLEGEAVILAS